MSSRRRVDAVSASQQGSAAAVWAVGMSEAGEGDASAMGAGKLGR